MIETLLQNKIFLAVIISAVLSQGIKIIMNMIKDKKGISITDFIVTGGMPSTHSALVTSLFVSLILDQGLSPLTIAAIVLFLIVVTDSMGVRRTAGEEGKVLNKIIKLEKLNIPAMHYSLGHKPIEVLAGMVIGFFVSVVVLFI